MDLGIKGRVALVAAASKGIGFAAALELAIFNEVAADNVTVNNVAPSYTLTERQNEVAEARASYISGVTLQVDGG
jgi:NAD(P)-dependent dehydrogenase (short-subunit alcohol dehydrogenase family)